MSKVDQKLDELLDIQGEIVEAEKSLPSILQNKDKIFYLECIPLENDQRAQQLCYFFL